MNSDLFVGPGNDGEFSTRKVRETRGVVTKVTVLTDLQKGKNEYEIRTSYYSDD